ncbi:MAG TPA: hypothetical protein VKV17_04680 [Bryobacteraceae bacterium]|nr:hypothetical protein [Bryobacteraceae bacterium]
MAAAPTSLTLRMYNVGFGDCFLLTFHYPKSERHMLVDFGSAAAPRYGTKDYMRRVAQDIARQAQGKLHIVVATHRHRDHISGFATDGEGTGKIIAGCNPDHVILPWTEDPGAAPDARAAAHSSYTGGKPDARQMTARFLASLEDMHRFAEAAVRLADLPDFGGGETRRQIRFLGEDNLKNLSAVENLMNMGKRGTAHYVNAGMALNGLVPGVKITVLGPPTLQQSESIRTQRVSDPQEFWQFCNLWTSRRPVARAATNGRKRAAPPPNVLWFIEQTRRINAEQTLEMVRELDTVLNNTSVILLLEAGKRKLLFPGDAQIENWAFALHNPKWRALLADVDLYKVGHHGSRNATPKSLWNLFRHKGPDGQGDRLQSLCSTRSGKHGSTRTGTEVPRHLLIEELRRESAFASTEDLKSGLAQTVELEL